ncbi:hypothetical protein PF008_g9898 [Phytophthora fragariae]|uniref:Uncharacterized protein n=1 Tax=Phytophthora fragariae TaxID=53985 RepID=A0A6G0RW91_9STRA|nr:hypothetical protein PF008_g9898 [Phytophthora fragariae]
MNKPPITLLSTLASVPTVRCSFDDPKGCKRPIRATHSPVLCAFHRDRADPEDGWAFISREEARLLNILRDKGWTDDALQDVMSLATESRPASPTSSIASLSERADSLRIDAPLSMSDLSCDSMMAVDLPMPGTPTE